MALVQSLFSERLTQKLHQLVLNRQTGMMRIEHINDAAHPADTRKRISECAEIYLSGGEVVLARSGSEVGVAALARIQSWQHAAFTFHEDATVPLQTLETARQWGTLQQHASQRTDSTSTALLPRPRLPKSTRPLPQVITTPTPAPPEADTTTEGTLPGRYAIFHAYPAMATPTTMKRLARRERIVFALLDGRRSLLDIAHLTHLSDESVARIVVQLYRQGYIEYLHG